MTEFVTPQLRTVLKTYQNSATKSLQGPGQSLSHHHHNNNTLSPGSIVKKELSSPEPLDVTETSISVIPPPPEISQPILSQPDTGRGELYETILEGKPIGCFLLGGEMRLCLPQFLNNVLTDFTLDQINRIFDDLRIFCSQCTPEQLMEFKAAKILPDDVKASGLITRTDAERLCAALLHRSDRCQIDIPKGAFTFKVYHRCFGKCEGICTPDLYTFDKPACIMCLECKGMFSPQKFVGHVHRQKENRTCHWGFDSRNWRDYLLVGLDVENRDKCAKMLDELRDLEQQEILNAQRDMSCLKRKAEMMEDPIMEPPLCKREPLDIPSKKAKIIDESSYLLDYQRYQQALYYAHCAQREQLSAFRPWAPKPILHLPFAAAAAYFSQEPPVLQNPERVVRHSESERFERTFQPNVALAPRKSILSKEREKEKERERDRERNHSAITNLTISETEIHIKQERPSTPDVIAQSPEEMRITSPTNSSNNLHQHRSRHHHHSHSHQSHNQCTTSTTMSSSSSSNTNNNHHTTPAPVSPEEFSGSNEITSSTSPVPNTNINNNGCNNASTPTSNTQQQTTAIVATINQKTADNNMIVCVPSRIHLNNISNNSADAARSPTPPSIREQYSINNNIKTRTIQLQSPPQSSSSLSSNAVGLTSGAAGSVVVKNVVNGAFIGATNSEFELSTDTDEDSLIGEPDSSNMTAPWDIAADALKDAQPSDRDKVLQVIKMLVHDNNQLRQYGIENAKLLQEIRHRDERIAELQQELQHHQRQLALFSPQSSISASTLNSIKQKMSGNGGVIAKAESCLTLRNDLTMMSSAYHQKPETEKIKVPLKKSSRRSPEDTVVVLNQNLHRDEVITEIKTVEINTCSSPSAKSLPTSNTTNSTSAATTTTSSSPDSAEYELKQQQQHQQQQQQQQQQQHQQQQQQQQRDVATIKCE